MPGSVTVARYHTQRRTIALGIAAAGGGFGTFIFPPIIEYLTEEYTWRGMFLILGAISLHISMFSLLYRPVKEIVTSYTELTSEKTSNKSDVTSSENSFRSKGSNKWAFCYEIDFILLSMSNFFHSFGASITFGHLGAFARIEYSIPSAERSLLYSYIGATIIVAKLFHGLIVQNHTNLFRNPYFQYILGYLLGGLGNAVVLIPNCGYGGLVVCAVFFGISFAACGGSLQPAILISSHGLDRLTLTYAVIMFMQAAGYLVGAPIGGKYKNHFLTLLSRTTRAIAI